MKFKITHDPAWSRPFKLYRLHENGKWHFVWSYATQEAAEAAAEQEVNPRRETIIRWLEINKKEVE